MSGVECEIDLVSLTEIVCILGAAPKGGESSDVQGAAQPGARGLDRRIWYGAHDLWNGQDYPDENQLPHADIVDTTLEFFEAITTTSKDPLGNVRGFFKPPVTSSYSFVSASDDASSLWLSRQPYNTSMESLEHLIQFLAWVPERDFSMFLHKWSFYSKYPTDRVKWEHSRRSRKVELHKGQAYYMDAWYKSGGGGEYLALAAVLHETDLNHKDKPDAIDEKQLISLQVDSSFAVYNLSLRGGGGAGATGEFKLVLGNKKSRAIPADASADYMTAALRELFSNCEVTLTDMPLERDSSGLVTDCRMGRGNEYRVGFDMI